MPRGPVSVLLYHPDAAADYARLVRAPRDRIRLHVASTREEAELHLAEAEVLYTWGFPGELLPRAKRLRWVQIMGAGVDRFLTAPLPPGVKLTRAPGVFGPWMAQYALGWLLWVTQRMEAVRQAQQARRWAPFNADRLHGRTLGILGAGSIGRAIARAARAFGMRVTGVTRSGRRVAGVDRVYGRGALRAFLREADWVVVVLPLTPETRGIIGEPELRAMKPSAWLVNIGRGALVEEAALIRALQERWIAGAILDVFPKEPLPPEHPLWALPNVVVTPHIAGPSTPEEIAPIFNANLRRYLADRRLLGLVDRRRGY
ncbi:MAG: D-2-hydroxyacid dehydrogenase [Candidatus Rokubacteria bacterium]|nr:D-2-hydroxyacid dehydrogenase [Candidatus Rokubacteria bacterium]